MERKTTVVATTHYAELKAYALDTVGAQNGCFEFDVETLRPTYRLLIGIPGRSNALAISKRLGLDEKLVESAKSFVSPENSRFEELVGKLEVAHTAAQRELAQARAIKSQLEQTKKSTSQRLAELGAEKDKIIEKARAEANAIIEATREKSYRLLNELEDLKKQLNKQNNADIALKARTLAKQSIKGLEQGVDSAANNKEKPKAKKPDRPLVAGDKIEISGFGGQGVVESVSPDGKFVFATIGSLKTKVSINDVSLIANNQPQPTRKPSMRKVKGLTPKSQREVNRELDIRGFACDEGIMELDKFLDEAVLSGVGTVTIIHGKGTGVLKKAVRAHLKNHPSVATSRPGVFGEGEDGVTVVEIK
jgi:DNA mismatch repair protein MutS2